MPTAMHRAGAEGSDGEAVMVADILRDVAETVAVTGVRRAAGEGNLAPAVAELTRDGTSGDGGGRGFQSSIS